MNKAVKVTVKKFRIIINLCMKRPSRRMNYLLDQMKQDILNTHNTVVKS